MKKFKSNDPLLRSSHQVKFGGGSSKTRISHLKEVKQFVEELRNLGYGVTHWENVTNKHVAAVVKSWQERDLAVATIKEYLSGVRAVARSWGNDKIAPDNGEFGIENRVYVSNQDKSISQENYERVIGELRSGIPTDHRVAAEVGLMRELGLRHEEARKFNPKKDVLSDGRVLISRGTKGGRERILHEVSAKGWGAIEYARSIMGKHKSLIPSGMREKEWEDETYYILCKHGISKETSNNSCHGFRHAYAHGRYEQITGFATRCLFQTREEFVANAEAIVGDKWQDLDRDARQILKGEMGHGPDRNDVVSNYLGSNSK